MEPFNRQRFNRLISELREEMEANTERSRERSLVETKLDEAVMWAGRLPEFN